MYKGKLPLKCFNYGGIGHFASKFPYPKHEDNDECPEDFKKNKWEYRKKKNTFYSLYDSFLNDSSDEEASWE